MSGTKICDISEFNTITNQDAAAKELKGLIIRMGIRGSVKSNKKYYGKIRADNKFVSHINFAKSYGIPFRVYFFPTSISTGEATEEAAYIKAMVDKYEIKSPVWLDSEMVDKGNGRADQLSKADRTKYLKVIVDYLKDKGIQCGIYASTSWLSSHIDMSQFDAGTRDLTWVAEYNNKCNYTGPYAMWQYTSSGSVSGIKGTEKGIDLSYDYAGIFGETTEEKKGSETMKKTNLGLIKYAKAQLGLPYWFGTFGQTATDALYRQKKKQLPSYYTASDFKSQYGKRVHDCSGLIKGYVWSDTPTSTPKYNASQDLSASAMYTQAKAHGTISSMPEIPGILLFKGSTPSKIHHVGIYGGDGYVYEAKGHAYGVVKTSFKKSEWQYWAKSTLVEYVSSGSNASASTTAAKNDKSITDTEVKAVQVILGKYGNNPVRRQRLGSSYTTVQSLVDDLLKDHDRLIETMARFVWGDYAGKGEARKKYLGEYAKEVQDKVNEMA